MLPLTVPNETARTSQNIWTLKGYVAYRGVHGISEFNGAEQICGISSTVVWGPNGVNITSLPMVPLLGNVSALSTKWLKNNEKAILKQRDPGVPTICSLTRATAGPKAGANKVPGVAGAGVIVDLAARVPLGVGLWDLRWL
jgi:hypothetical protein